MAKKTNITKKHMVNFIAKDKEIYPNDIHQIIQAFLGKIIDCLAKGERLEFRDFGTFEVVKRKQKTGRNPKKADIPIIIPARFVVKFKPGKKMERSCIKKLI